MDNIIIDERARPQKREEIVQRMLLDLHLQFPVGQIQNQALLETLSDPLEWLVQSTKVVDLKLDHAWALHFHYFLCEKYQNFFYSFSLGLLIPVLSRGLDAQVIVELFIKARLGQVARVSVIKLFVITGRGR
jgi:hypothetical protein